MRIRADAWLGTVAAALLACAGLNAPLHAQTRDDIITQLNHFDSPPTLDLPALRTQTQERSKIRSRTEPPPQKRPPIAPDLMTLPAFTADIQFDVDTPIVRPESYQTIGRIADAMVHSTLLPYTFLIVGHIEANGKREPNVTLSQRRADAIRDVLANTFKISIKRLASLGVGEEQFIDQAHPGSAVNQQIQIITIGKVPETEAPAAAAPTAAKKGAKKKK